MAPTVDPSKLLVSIIEDLNSALVADRHTSRLQLHDIVQDTVAEVPACVLVADDAGRLVAASRVALKTLGHTLDSLRNHNVTELAATEERDVVEPLWETFRQQRRQSGGFALRRRDGTTVRTRYVAQSNAVAGLAIAVHVADVDGSRRPTVISNPRHRQS